MIKDYFVLAFKSAKKRKIRSWLTMIGIFIGIASVVAILSLSQGLQEAVLGQFANIGSDKLVVQAAGGGFGPPGEAVVEPLHEKDKKAVAQTKGVDVVMGRLIRSAQVEFKDELRFSYLVSMPKDDAERELIFDVLNYEVAEGKMFDKNANFEILINQNFADTLFEEEMGLRDKILVQGQEFKIVGILKETGDPRTDTAFLIPEKSMKEVLRIDDEIDFMAAQVEPGENIELVAERMENSLRDSRNVEQGKENFQVQFPQNVVETLTSVLAVLQGVLVGIASISLLVGAIGIMNTMYTSVYERTKEIGIMKAIGASRKKILLLFLLESGMLGLSGGAIGVLLGLGVSKSVELVAKQQLGASLIQADFGFGIIGGAMLFAFCIGTFSGVFPAMQASKMEIVDALRK